MSIVCGHCQRTLEFSGDPPKFCAYCGRRLAAAAVVSPDALTLAPDTVGYEVAPETTPEDTANPFGAAPATIGGYRLLRKLGEGGMGTVFEAESPDGGQRVAVKLLATQFARHATSLERFRQEGQLASLIAHPRCVFVLAADEECGRPYIVMELMPGDTLRDLVNRRGPLPPLDAVTRILDVIDGLREAHRLGIVHRDVKPSNCFMMPDGRVKVGDFGLAKSLTGNLQLTMSGAFLGTVLYASPEQIRGEGVDFASDVYAVCGTLYYLLTGQAPFQHENAGAVLAKVISEDPPPIRPMRPDVSRRLERIVLKGLERDKSDRWHTLDELHAVLKSFVPRTMTRGTLGLRFAAFLVDTIALFLVSSLWTIAQKLGLDAITGDHPRVTEAVEVSVEFAYYAVGESVWGCTLGKLFLRLRVCPADGTGLPSWRQSLVRTAVFVGCLSLPGLAGGLLGVPGPVILLLGAVGLVALFGTMRARNGFRGLHEFASGTRVVRLSWTPRPRPFLAVRERFPPQPPPAGRFPDEIGQFRVRGVLHSDERATVLLGDDPALGREVHIWLRPAEVSPVSAARRSLARPIRPRWLGGGECDGRTWDAYFAPQGCPLADLVTAQAPLGWTEGRFILEQLADELHEARLEGTLPSELGLDQVWVLPDGRAQLLDFDLDGQYGFSPDDAGAMSLLRQVAELAVEGDRRPPNAPPRSIRAPVPRHAIELLDRLLGVRQPFTSLAELRTALAETHDRPTETDRALRVAHVGFQGMFLAVGLVWMFAFSGLFGWFDLFYMRLVITLGEWAQSAVDDPDLTGGPLKSAMQKYNADGRLKELLEQQSRKDQEYLEWRRRGANAAERLLDNMTHDFEMPDTDQVRQATFEASATRAREDSARPKHRWSVHADSQTLGDELSPTFIVFLLGFFPAAWTVWAFATRGGLALPVMGLALVRLDGRKAARWQCAWRALLVWLPFTLPLLVCVWVKMAAPELRIVHTGLWWLAVAVLLAEVIWPLYSPRRALHDRLAGTCLVPL